MATDAINDTENTGGKGVVSSDLLAGALSDMIKAYASLQSASHDNRNELARGRDRVRIRNARSTLEFYRANIEVSHPTKED